MLMKKSKPYDIWLEYSYPHYLIIKDDIYDNIILL